MSAMTGADDMSAIHAMNIRIAFAGKRDLGEQSALFSERLDEVFSAIAAVARRIADSPVASNPGETVLSAHEAALPECAKGIGLTLLTGYADGADRIAAIGWRRLGLGAVHAVFPFRDPSQGVGRREPTHGWTHGPRITDTTYRVDLRSPPDLVGGFDRFTVLDGAESAKEKPPRHGHLEQTRLLTRWADVAVVAWDGKAAAGPGGTADLVALCLAKRMPIIWINPTEPDLPIRQIFPGEFWADVHFGEFLHSLDEPGALALNAPPFKDGHLEGLLLPHFMPPAPPAIQEPRKLNGGDGTPEAEAPDSHSDLSEPDMRVRYLTDIHPTPPPGWFLAEFCAPLWSIVYRHPGHKAPSVTAPVDSSKGAMPDIHRLITSAFRTADARASTVGDAHRGTQIFILLLAPLAVLLATLPALHPSGKFWYVLAELALILLASFLYLGLVKYGSHHYWSDVRRLAERLRVLRATWPLAFDVADSRADPPETWTEWLARVIRRAAGPPRGLIDIASKRNAIKFAQQDPDGILNHQVNYQALTELRAGKLHDRLHWLEKWFFRILVGLLVLFLARYLLSLSAGWDKPSVQFGGVVMIASAVIPVIAAIFLATEAKFDLRENAKKAAGLAGQFKKVSDRISTEKNQSRDEELLREAALILLNDVDQWREGAVRRSPVNL